MNQDLQLKLKGIMSTSFYQGMWLHTEHFVCKIFCREYIEIEEKKLHILFCQCEESFSKGFMIITGFSYNEKLKIRKVGKKMLKSTQSTVK